MSKFEWMELETLSNEIAHSQSRLDAARASKNHGLVRLLEREIAETAERRARVLADITKGLGAGSSARPNLSSVPAQKIVPKRTEREAHRATHGEALITTDVASPEPARHSDTIEGVATVWDQLKHADIERFKRVLSSRRSEILARHSEELKALEAEQIEIDAIEQAIEVFARKFKLTGGAEVVPFAAELAHSEAS